MYAILIISEISRKERNKNMKKNKKEEDYFLSLEEMKNEKGNFSFLSESGVFLGKKDRKIIIENSKMYSIIFDDSIGNKNCKYAIIFPTLLKSWKESVITLDYNGEIYKKTSGVRKEKMNNKILKLDLDANFFCNYNPFEEVRIMSEYEMEDIENIIYPIFEKELLKSQKNNSFLNMDSYYIEASKILIANIIYYLLYKEFLRRPKFVIENDKKIPISSLTFKDIINFFNNKNEEDKLKEILELLNENTIEKYGKDEKTKKYVKDKLYELNNCNELIEQGKLPKIHNYLKNVIPISIIFTAKSFLNDFEKMFVNFSSSKSNFRLLNLMNYEKPISLYLIYNKKNIGISKILYKILLNQFIRKSTSRNFNRKSNCLLFIDNSKLLGKNENLELSIGYIAFYGIKIIMSFESFEQVKQIYETTTILNNFQFKIEKANKMKSDKILINLENFKPLLLDSIYYYNDAELKKLSEISEI